MLEQDKRYAQGEVLQIIRSSPVRQAPRCPAFGVCGGCDWQHLPYSLQWETKSKGVFHALQRTQVEIPSSFDAFPAEQIWEYRNRIQLRGEGKQLGFFKSGSRDLVPVNRCDIARTELNQAWELTRSEGLCLTRPYKVEVEVKPNGEVTRVWNSRHSSGGFRQVHDEQNGKLRAWIEQVLSPVEVLYDLYGGSGNLSLPLAGKLQEIHCVDLGSPRERPAGVAPHFYFHRSAVLPWLFKQRSLRPLKKTAAAIVDPPREGLGKELNSIAAQIESLGVTELISVGCDPDAWAGDLSRWQKRGWRLDRIALVDLFPQTHHVESMGRLLRGDRDSQ